MTSSRLNFTKKQVTAIRPPKEGRQDYQDTETKELHLRVTHTGTKTFYLYYWNPKGGESKKGGPERITLGKFGDAVPPPEFETDPKCLLTNKATLTVEMARKMAKAVLGDLSASRTKIEDVKRKKEEITLSGLFAEYIERHAKKKRKTWEEMQRCFDRWFCDWKDRPVSSVSRDDVERMHGSVSRDRGLYAANRALELLRAVYNKGIEWKLYVGENPARGVSEFEEHARDRVLEAHEMENFFRSLNQEPEDDIKDFVMLALLTGARKANVLGMRWHDVSLHHRTWRITAAQSKNSRAQTIPLTDAEMDIILRRRDANDRRDVASEFVFPGTGRTGHLVEPKKPWKRILTRAGITDLHIHDLRRSLASWMANTGANVALIQSALNHQDVKTTLTVYARTRNDAELAAREKAHEQIFKLGKIDGENNIVVLKKTPTHE